MNLNKVYVGNNLDILKTFPDNSINCCITSPPYYGLRDYGTGVWVGGDPECTHFRESKCSDTNISTGHIKQQHMNLGVGDAIYKSVCPRCGAVRVDEQIGLEETPEAYIDRLVSVFREIRRCLTDDGTLWLNIGDTYEVKGSDTSKPKDLIGIPWMLAFALKKDGWYLRQDIIWHKPNPMPESVTDRCTKAHEYIFLLSKSQKYYFDHESMKEDAISADKRAPGVVRERVLNYNSKRNLFPENYLITDSSTFNVSDVNSSTINNLYTGKRNKRDVWTINVSSFKGAHFATFPEDMVKNCLLAGCPKDGVVLDPFMGSGTVGVVAKKYNRKYVGCELNEKYAKIANNRISVTSHKLF